MAVLNTRRESASTRAKRSQLCHSSDRRLSVLWGYENEDGINVCENFNEERDRVIPAVGALRNANITTYVVGFGGFNEVDPYTLHDSAIAAAPAGGMTQISRQ